MNSEGKDENAQITRRDMLGGALAIGAAAIASGAAMAQQVMQNFVPPEIGRAHV